MSPSACAESGRVGNCGCAFAMRWEIFPWTVAEPDGRAPDDRLRELDQFLLEVAPSAMRGLYYESAVDFSTVTVVPIFTRL
jgi:hypothetical protein